MKKINDLLPTAMAELRESKLVLSDGKSILKEYDGYIASFAPSIITAGLKATLSFYTDQHKTLPKRMVILTVLQRIYEQKIGGLQNNNLLDYALQNARTEDELRTMKKGLIDCAIALKLVMRNFEQVEKEHQPETITTNVPVV